MAARPCFDLRRAVIVGLALAMLAGCAGAAPTIRPFSFSLPSLAPLPGTPASTSDVEALLTLVAGNGATSGLLDTFWTDAAPGLTDSPTYRRPSEVRSYLPDQPIDTACPGDESGPRWNRNAYYCPRDETVSWERVWFADMQAELGALAPVAVIAHEWGHHIQRLTQSPTAKLASENQADCYSGAFFRRADDRGWLDAYVPGGDVRDAVSAIYRLGNSRFVASEWYSQYGPPRSRQLAFALGSLALSPSACELYQTFEYRTALQLGWYTLDPPASFNVTESGAARVMTEDDVTAAVIPLPNLSDAPAVDQFDAAAAAWLGSDAYEWVNDVYRDPFTGRLGGTSAIRTYEQRLTNADGTTKTIHGDVILQTDAGHGGILFDVYLPGEAPTDNLDGLTQWAAIVVNGLCPGGEGTTLPRGRRPVVTALAGERASPGWTALTPIDAPRSVFRQCRMPPSRYLKRAT